MLNNLPIQDCVRCNKQPTLDCDTKEASHKWNISHRCSDGLVARGARGYYRDEVIKAWNHQQIAIAVDTA